MTKEKKKKLALAGKIRERPGLSLSKLVAQITKGNRYPEISTGPARGEELA